MLERLGRWRTRRIAGFPAPDVALALVLLVIAIVSVLTGNPDEGPTVVTLPAAVATTLAVAWRVRSPFVAVGLIAAAGVVQSLLAGGQGSLWALVASAIVTYSAAAYYPEGKAAVAGVIVVAANMIAERIDNGVDYLFVTVLFGGIWLLGRASRLWRGRVGFAEQHQQDLARLAVAEERVRIARELHDIVAHSLSVIAVQSDAAEAALGREPELARAPLKAIRTSARDSLGEIRRLLQVLRTEEDAAAGDTVKPAAGIAGIPQLVTTARAAGLPVELSIDTENASLPPVIDLAAYRIVQEALTNVIKHAGLVSTRVTVRQGPLSVELEVANAPGKPPGGRSRGVGLGLLGIRERVTAANGSLEAGTSRDGGFRVLAALPVTVPIPERPGGAL